jgi:hypothetical protein
VLDTLKEGIKFGVWDRHEPRRDVIHPTDCNLQFKFMSTPDAV